MELVHTSVQVWKACNFITILSLLTQAESAGQEWRRVEMTIIPHVP